MKDQDLEVLCCEEKIKDIFLDGPDINRPGLELAGYADNFANDRIQLLGNVEMQYLYALSPKERIRKMEPLFQVGFPCMIIARNLEPCENMLEIAIKYNIPILRTEETTTAFYSELNSISLCTTGTADNKTCLFYRSIRRRCPDNGKQWCRQK